MDPLYYVVATIACCLSVWFYQDRRCRVVIDRMNREIGQQSAYIMACHMRIDELEKGEGDETA